MSDIFSPGRYRLTVEQTGNGWNLASDRVADQERMRILCATLRETLPRLGFEPLREINAEGKNKLILPVIAPQRRYWSESVLTADDILAPAATFEVREDPPGLFWNQNGVTASAILEEGANIRIQNGVISRVSALPAIALGDARATWRPATSELDLEATATFVDCPPFEDIRDATVVVANASESFNGRFDPASGRLAATLILAHAHPRTLDLHVVWQAEWQDAPLVSELKADVPIQFGTAEFKSAGRDFASHIYVGVDLERVRFGQHVYVPDELVLVFTRGMQASRCVVRRRDDAMDAAEYDEVEWLGEPLDFRNAAPGVIFLTLEGETRPPREVTLLPGVIEGTWTLVSNKSAFRLASRTLREGLIEKASDCVTAELVDAKVTRGVVTLSATTGLITHFVLTDGSRVPLNPGKFSPLFLRDPLSVWKLKQRPRTRFAGDIRDGLGSPRHLRVAGATSIDDPLTDGTIATSIVQNAVPGPSVFELGGKHQLLLHQHEAPEKPGMLIRSDVAPANTLLGLYFRGFYFIVEAVDVQGEFAPGSKLLRLRKPMPLDFGVLTNHVMAFSPLRASFSNEQSAVVIVVERGHVIVLPLDEAGVIGDVPDAAFNRLGYLYRSGQDGLHWSPAGGRAEPEMYTFDNLAFKVEEKYVSFEGWLLPGGVATFDAQPPFTPYAFDFTGNPVVAIAILDPFPLRVRDWEIPPPDMSEEEREKFNAEVKETLLEMGGGAEDQLQQINRAEFSISLSENRQYQGICEWNSDTNQVRLRLGRPLRTPAVQFFILP
ncbi:MAG TPA: hypothetical protein VF057_11080 [Thermoanaerobaculia bacterium]